MNVDPKDSSIFNTINPDALEPRATKQLPFPLENFDQEIAITYDKLVLLLIKLQAAEKNPANHTPAKKRRLKSLKYKIKTSIDLVREVSTSFTQLWF